MCVWCASSNVIYQSRLIFGVEPTPKLVLHTMVCGIWIGCSSRVATGCARTRLVCVEAVCHSLFCCSVDQGDLWVVFAPRTSCGSRPAICEAIGRLTFLFLCANTEHFKLVSNRTRQNMVLLVNCARSWVTSIHIWTNFFMRKVGRCIRL